jgi:two-component system, cell cycle sensor histidine kinase and response regulator CckA
LPSETSRFSSSVENRDTAVRYAVALLVFALGYLGRLALAHVLGFTIPYITFFPAIALSAWYGGFGPGVLITALSASSVLYLFLGAGGISTADIVGLILFLSIGILISWLNHALRRSRRRAQNELLARQLSEEALRESEELYRVMTDAAVDAIITIDEQSRILFVNRAAERIFGYSMQELHGKSLTMLMPESMRDSHRAGVNRYLQTGRKHIAWAGTELVGLHKEGHEVPLEISFGEMRRGSQRLFTGVIRDITDRKQSEDRLRQSEQRFRALIENSSDAIALIDANGTILYASSSTTRVLDYSPEEVVNRSALDMIHPDDRQRARQMLTSLVQQPGASLSIEFRVRHKDGSWRWIEGIASNGLNDPNILALVANYRDTSERRRLEEQFLQAQKMEAIGRLAGGVAHDFNNLLTVINGYSALALDMATKDSPLYSDLQEINKAGLRAAALTNQLLAFSRRQVLEPKVLNLNTIVSDMDRMLRRLIGEDIDLVTVLDPVLGSVLTDRGQIEQAIMNLVVNSRHAMPDGGQLTIETANVELDDAYAREHSGVVPGSYVMLAVSDTGIGMDEQIQTRIFEPFFTTKQQGEGTGLGLSMVYGFLKQSGGNIWVYSEPGKGTTFKIYLPRVTERPARSSQERRPAPPLRGSEMILVVEDEEGIRKLIRSILQQAGYTVVDASNGAEALRFCETHSEPIHLMISDVVMPQMSGRELANRLASLRPEIKVLFMSGYTDNAIVRHGVLEPDTPFLQKPFTPVSLTNKVREVLEGSAGRSYSGHIENL